MELTTILTITPLPTEAFEEVTSIERRDRIKHYLVKQVLYVVGSPCKQGVERVDIIVLHATFVSVPTVCLLCDSVCVHECKTEEMRRNTDAVQHGKYTYCMCCARQTTFCPSIHACICAKGCTGKV